MGDSIKALQDMATKHKDAYELIKKDTNSAIQEFIDVNEAMLKSANEKDFEKLKKGVIAAVAKLEKAGTSVQFGLESWHKAGEQLDSALQAEIKVREKEYKDMWDRSQEIVELNKKIAEVNKKRAPKDQIPAEKPLEVPTDAVATVKSAAATLMFQMKIIEAKQDEIKDWLKDIANRKKTVPKLKFADLKKKKK
jgi:hypothetical protein